MFRERALNLYLSYRPLDRTFSELILRSGASGRLSIHIWSLLISSIFQDYIVDQFTLRLLKIDDDVNIIF